MTLTLMAPWAKPWSIGDIIATHQTAQSVQYDLEYYVFRSNQNYVIKFFVGLSRYLQASTDAGFTYLALKDVFLSYDYN